MILTSKIDIDDVIQSAPPDYIIAAMDSEKILTQTHYPGYNYLGPGTKVITNLVNGVKPIDYIDKLAMIHDIEYIKQNYYSSDLIAIKDSYNKISLPSIAMRAGLLARMAVNYKPKDVYNPIYRDKIYEYAVKLAKGLNYD